MIVTSRKEAHDPTQEWGGLTVPCASLYTEPPAEEITLDEFEIYALERLKLLRHMEVLKLKNIEGDALKRELSSLVAKHMPLRSTGSAQADALSVRKDCVSHFILRLAYCRTEELRRWFLVHECLLFKHRLEAASSPEINNFLKTNRLQFDLVGDRNSLGDDLDYFQIPSSESIYRIPFIDALSLVGSRAVLLRDGFAFVPFRKLTSIIQTKFRSHLSRALTEASNMFEAVSGDARIGPMLKTMNKQYVGRDFSKDTSVEKLTYDQVDGAAELHMPLCMKNLHNSLQRDHKLKHWGRLQYGLFLKGAGLEMEDAIQFWESHFSRIVSHDQFVKQYAYSFRHMYGKEGARKAYTPYSCMKIIMGTPPEPGAFHGCPYRHASDAQLGSMLMLLKLDSKDVADIGKTARSGAYQIACQKHFDATHPGHLSMNLGTGDDVSNHPNQWFRSSVEYHKMKSLKQQPDASLLSTQGDKNISLMEQVEE